MVLSSPPPCPVYMSWLTLANTAAVHSSHQRKAEEDARRAAARARAKEAILERARDRKGGLSYKQTTASVAAKKERVRAERVGSHHYSVPARALGTHNAMPLSRRYRKQRPKQRLPRHVMRTLSAMRGCARPLSASTPPSCASSRKPTERARRRLPRKRSARHGCEPRCASRP